MPLIYLVHLYNIKQYIANLLIFGKHFMYISKQESNFCFWLVTLQSQMSTDISFIYNLSLSYLYSCVLIIYHLQVIYGRFLF